ncbi:hypothetical protein [Diaphorobacter sp. J5-51]|uniref:ParB/RepB/Spo0J family partition protein n=1 Tax=Diaphorobacter sp. J5-51 TaxID=680496 RepID=UPI00069A01D4|nr:hypothetical protein [Diaphorobacter sp. J5-51]
MEHQKVLGSFKAQAANSTETGVKKTDLYRIPPEKLQEEPGFNERDYNDPEVMEQITAFEEAYFNGSYVPPLIVRIDPTNGDIFIVDGHQRLRGAKRAIERGAPIEHLDCLPFRGGNDERILLMLTSAQGLKLKPLGVANSYLRLTRMGKSVADIARHINRTTTHVEAMLVLATANMDVRELVREGKVSATMAVEAVREHGEKAGPFLQRKFQEIKAQGKQALKPSAIREWAPSRKIAGRMFDSLEQAYKGIMSKREVKDLLIEIETSGDETVVNKTISVDAAIMVDLIRLFQEVEGAKKKSSGKNAGAGQMNLPG